MNNRIHFSQQPHKSCQDLRVVTEELNGQLLHDQCLGPPSGPLPDDQDATSGNRSPGETTRSEHTSGVGTNEASASGPDRRFNRSTITTRTMSTRSTTERQRRHGFETSRCSVELTRRRSQRQHLQKLPSQNYPWPMAQNETSRGSSIPDCSPKL